MGKFLSKALKKLSADGPKRILMLGLDNAGRLLSKFFFLNHSLLIFEGKTTVLYRMKRTEDYHTVPTVGK